MSIRGFKINGVTERYNYPDLDNKTVQTEDIVNGAVTENKIAPGAVTENKIADGSVSENKLGEDVSESINNKANPNGLYEGMTVGNAEQLVSTVGVTDRVPYNFRTSGGSVDIGDREVDTIVGGTIVWNQLLDETKEIDLDYGSQRSLSFAIPAGVSIIAGHKYLFSAEYFDVVNAIHTITCSLYTRTDNTNRRFVMLQRTDSGKKSAIFEAEYSGTSNVSGGLAVNGNLWCYVAVNNLDAECSCTISKLQLFDLTVMFGSAVADYIYSLEQSTEGSGVAWFRSLFSKDLYAFNSGELMSVNTSAHKMVGFNQMNPENYIISSGSNYNLSPGTALSSGGSAASVSGSNPILIDSTTNWQGAVFISEPLIFGMEYQLTVISAANPDSGKRMSLYIIDDNNVVKRRISNYIGTAADSVSARYTPDEYNLRFALDVEHTNAQTVSISDLCVHLVWDGERDGDYEPYIERTYLLDSNLTLRGIPKLDANNDLYYDGDTYEADGTVTRKYGVRAYTSGDTTNGSTMITDGTNTVYEFATPTTESTDPYDNPQTVDDFGTEEYVDARTIPIPVGHTTWYQNNLRAKLEMAPNSPNGDGIYLVKQENGINVYIPFIKELPAFPTEDGTYSLKYMKNGSTILLSWIAEV